jgi:hypothetical protein
MSFFPRIRTLQHLDIIKAFCSPTNPQMTVLKNNIKVDIQTAPT